LKGGGGGTFGIVTRMTLKTHDLPETFGAVLLTVQASSDDAFKRLLKEFLAFSGRSLVNPNWGEQVRATPGNRLIVEMVFQGLDAIQAEEIWKPFLGQLARNAAEWKQVDPFKSFAVSGRRFWDGDFISHTFPQAIKRDGRPGVVPGDYWWSGDDDQVGAYWSAYVSLWLPRSSLSGAGLSRLAAAWYQASRHWPVSFHFNKGLAGAQDDALAATRDTAMNPEVLTAFALAIISSAGPMADRGLSQKDEREARTFAARVREAEGALRAAAPSAGSYVSESDYFLADWKRASWGSHWRRLEAIKQTWDPDGLFVVHHGVGSDRWSRDGFTRLV